jgi:2-keto-3-deoxy-6-phosphogluconate aldolase
MKNEFKADKFDEMPVIGILRNVPLPEIEAILPFYIKAGFTNLEVTMNSNGAEETIRSKSSVQYSPASVFGQPATTSEQHATICQNTIEAQSKSWNQHAIVSKRVINNSSRRIFE